MLALLLKVFKTEKKEQTQKEENVVNLEEYIQEKQKPQVQLRDISKRKRVRFGFDSEEEYQTWKKEKERKEEEEKEYVEYCQYFG